ncbi:class I SAM-dependent methyltransferase [Cellulomonas alba]|uniref:Class I SAM-dependent methyltransferase n=1 Tax=Cellulomonas alba TaxID=3053467 RepID=A0ABT7SCD6_9CELL|nr:class I SAM-dependent methyltransferase [Cellulomonas alba]MDM7853848.1 class I SAM-dependent methyltransferase [Cellulomonas alba]
MVNDGMRQTWTAGAEHWVANEALLDGLYVPVTAAILDAAGLAPGVSVLDVGCGTGTLLEAGAAAGAAVTGVDISAEMAAAAARRVPSADVVVDDAQTADLRAFGAAPFDRVVSRFGVMFFDDPVAAFANIHAASAPGARLAFACWRPADENPMFTLGTSVLLEATGSDAAAAAPGASGPMAFEDPGRVVALLTAAGWSDVELAPLDFTCDYGPDGVDARLAVIFGTTAGIRARRDLEARVGAPGWALVVDEVRDELRRWQGDAPTLTHPAAVWVTTATA